jgi:hypothetical protein
MKEKVVTTWIRGVAFLALGLLPLPASGGAAAAAAAAAAAVEKKKKKPCHHSATATTTMTPPRVGYAQLIAREGGGGNSNDDAINEVVSALRAVGMISITDVAGMERKYEVMETLEKCVMMTGQATEDEKKKKKKTVTVTYPDGTVRTTVATELSGLTETSADPLLDACGEGEDTRGGEELATSIRTFRRAASDALQQVVDRLSQALHLEGVPVLLTAPSMNQKQQKEEGAKEEGPAATTPSFYTFSDLLRHGQQLEHFHVYRAQDAPAAAASAATIDWHTDIGWALAFVPAAVRSRPSRDFYISLPGEEEKGEDGGSKKRKERLVEFGPQDDLVLLLGDGVHQYINPALRKLNQPAWRPVPHAMVLSTATEESSEQQQHRLWYGRMLLPPPQALYPDRPDLKYEQVMQHLNHPHQDQAMMAAGVGCSPSMSVARHLDEDVECDGDTQFHCWHRCFNYTDDLSPQVCRERDLELACVNGEGLLWNGTHDPAFGPDCVDVSKAEVAPGPGQEEEATTNGGDENHTDHAGGDVHTDDGGATSSSIGKLSVVVVVAKLIVAVFVATQLAL